MYAVTCRDEIGPGKIPQHFIAAARTDWPCSEGCTDLSTVPNGLTRSRRDVNISAVKSSRRTPVLWLLLAIAAVLSVVRGGASVPVWTAATGEHRAGFIYERTIPAEAIRVGPLSFRHVLEARREDKSTAMLSAPPKQFAVYAAAQYGPCCAAGSPPRGR
jgi:hypothetical protein